MLSEPRINYARMARIEWCQLILFNFPIPFISPVLFLFSEYQALGIYDFVVNSVPQLLAIVIGFILLTVVVAKIINLWRVLISGVRTDLIPYAVQQKLETIIKSRGGQRKGIVINSMEVNLGDFTMGAHVRGVISPIIVVSGGMLVGLLRNDAKAWAILNHEAAHIEQYDMLLPGFMGLSLIEIFGTPLQFLFTQPAEALETNWLIGTFSALIAYKLIILGLLFFGISRIREYYADAGAIATSIDRDGYIVLLSSLLGPEKSRFSLFHPSVKQRIRQVKSGFPAISLALPWRGYFAIATLVSGLQWKYGAEDMSSEQFYYTFCNFWMGFLILFSELFRDAILKSAIRTTPYRFPKTLMRYGILLGGFGFAAYAGTESDIPTLTPLIGGVFYVIFRATKNV